MQRATMAARFGALLLLACAGSAAVLELDGGKLDETVRHHRTFVMFFAPWCGHCKRMKGAWDKLADPSASSRLDGTKVARVDCTRHASVCTKYAVRSFPSLLLFDKGGKKIRKHTGGRDIDSLAAFARSGYKQAPEYDPAKVPPPPPRRSVLGQLGLGNSFMTVFLGVLLLLLLGICSCACRAHFARVGEEEEQQTKQD